VVVLTTGPSANRALEARGFEPLFECVHIHIPVSGRSPYPGGGELPKRYSHTHDPIVVLSFAAAATRTLMLGTGIALVPQSRRPEQRLKRCPRRSAQFL
jgi:alkanesulfonate monooxygenase SsuD/methylene tetrahydromethanopterin reductase-like flavin-dependent oxidoreductase (luciferase family)